MVIFQLRLTQVETFCYEAVDVKLVSSADIEFQGPGYCAAFCSCNEMINFYRVVFERDMG